MSLCLNPECEQMNPRDATHCHACDQPLLLQRRYRALAEIGRGAFGKTFKAEDEGRPSKPYCTIKQLFYNDVATRQKSIELFEAEAIQLDRLGDHAQIPTLLWQGQQDDRHYIVQEYIDGQTLAAELAEQGAFSEAQIWQLLTDLLPVLERIHDVQVIHRDIKPQNIIRRRRDRRLVLVDFGAVKVATQTALAKTGTSIGSAEYAAPEQIRGKPTFASDLYALGATCVHLLTQMSPFQLYSDYEGCWVWRDFVPQGPVSDKLGQILDRLLEEALGKRYTSAAAVLHEMNPSVPLPALEPSLPQPLPSTAVSPVPETLSAETPSANPPVATTTSHVLEVDLSPGQPLAKAGQSEALFDLRDDASAVSSQQTPEDEQGKRKLPWRYLTIIFIIRGLLGSLFVVADAPTTTWGLFLVWSGGIAITGTGALGLSENWSGSLPPGGFHSNFRMSLLIMGAFTAFVGGLGLGSFFGGNFVTMVILLETFFEVMAAGRVGKQLCRSFNNWKVLLILLLPSVLIALWGWGMFQISG